ncbi:helix-turn-helix domain-containing protein [Hamadaea tsunoensis]|uniref:helix-turn-helix domain-containing protein n=1 Tax=Hamadaea tsunoensis TaxID=53368 RepID=UPI0004155BFC|nr:helix-turn-helix domain-containing protein [Hamadaea tsunoensis]
MDESINLSAQSLKGVAHPLRVRLLALLREEGPSTATRLAERIGQSSGVTSYHLRQLAVYGFVTDDAERGTGRERWWRAVHRGMSLDTPAAREAPAESEAYMRAVAAQYAERVDRWLYELPSMPEPWQEAIDLSNYWLRLTPEEGADLVTRVRALIGEYRRDDADEPVPDGMERVAVQVQVMPFVRDNENGQAA